MNKNLTVPLFALGMLSMTACNNTQSIRSDDMYTVISEKRMPYYCRQEAAKHFGLYPEDIFTYPLMHDSGTKLIYGRYRAGHKDLKEFVCIFNADDTYAGLKIRNSFLKSKLCEAGIKIQ